MNTDENTILKGGAAARFSGVPVLTVALMVAASAVCAVMTHGGPYSGALWFIFAAGLTSFLLYISDSCLPLIAPLAAVILSYFVFSDVSVWTFAVIPVAFLVCASANGKMKKNTALICASGAVILFALLHFVTASAMAGDFSLRAVTALAVRPYNEFKVVFSEYTNALAAESGEAENFLSQYGALSGQLLEEIRNELIKISPALVICSALVLSWLCSAVLALVARFFVPDRMPQGETVMSVASAYVFSAAYLISLLFGSSGSLNAFVVTADNISIILMPGFFALGFSAALRGAKRRNGGFFYIIFCVTAVFLMIASMGSAAVLFVFIGVVVTFKRRYFGRSA